MRFADTYLWVRIDEGATNGENEMNREQELIERYDWYGPHLAYLGSRDDFKSERANLRLADLSCADLRDANLRLANLSDANLSNAKSNSVCRMDFGGWSICIRENETSIGCQTKENAFWLRVEPKDVKSMGDGAQEWWEIHGDAIKATIKCVMEK